MKKDGKREEETGGEVRIDHDQRRSIERADEQKAYNLPHQSKAVEKKTEKMNEKEEEEEDKAER